MNILGRSEWIQVDLRKPTRVVAVVTQGINYPGTEQHRITGFKISYGNSTNSLQVIQSRNDADLVNFIDLLSTVCFNSFSNKLIFFKKLAA